MRAEPLVGVVSGVVLATGFPVLASAQPLTETTMNLDAPLIAPAGATEFLFNHRVMVEGGHVENMPTFTIARGISDRWDVGLRYASHSLVNGQLNELEPLVRLQLLPAGGRMALAAIAAYNTAATSVDAGLLAGLRIGALDLHVAGRGYSSGDGVGGPTASAGVGLIWHLNPMFALSMDYNTLVAAQNRAAIAALFPETGILPTWSAGINFLVPFSPHSMGLYVTNGPSRTLQGVSFGTRDVMVGFEFLVPLSGPERWGALVNPPAMRP